MQDNYQRLVRVKLEARVSGLRFVPETTWGASTARVFAFDPIEVWHEKIPILPNGPRFSQVVAGLNPADLKPPENGLEIGEPLKLPDAA